MTWTKLGDEFSDAARDLTDAAYRTHVDALCWSNRRGLDLVVPKRDLRRFGETSDPDLAAKELVTGGWWEDRGDAWWIGVLFADWQQESTVIAKRREQSALTTRRSRLHGAGDHSLCLPGRCAALKSSSDTSAYTSRDASQSLSHDGSPGTGRGGAVRDGHGEAPPALLDVEKEEGEGGLGGGPTYPKHCAKHAHDPSPPYCNACKVARIAYEAAPSPAPPTRPSWCGNCHEPTRQREDGEGRAYRCPDCHADPDRRHS